MITAIAGLIWALNSLQNSGVNLNSFNPFFWLRRRRWEKQLGVKPMHGLTDSMEVAALLVVAVAKEHGDVARETKQEILTIFEEEFGIKRSKAAEMYSSSMYYIQDSLNMSAEVRNILKPSLDSFTQDHKTKLLKMLEIVIKLDGEIKSQRAIIIAVEAEFKSSQIQGTEW
jgi:uncharacterized tellurite resistance protein B-like protein